jgi:hypothetical protein
MNRDDIRDIISFYMSIVPKRTKSKSKNLILDPEKVFEHFPVFSTRNISRRVPKKFEEATKSNSRKVLGSNEPKKLIRYLPYSNKHNKIKSEGQSRLHFKNPSEKVYSKIKVFPISHSKKKHPVKAKTKETRLNFSNEKINQFGAKDIKHCRNSSLNFDNITIHGWENSNRGV